MLSCQTVCMWMVLYDLYRHFQEKIETEAHINQMEAEESWFCILVVKVQFKLIVYQRLNQLQSLKSEYFPSDLHWGQQGRGK